MDYFDINLDLSEKDLALKKMAHDFAREKMRPVAKELDQMTPDEVIADGSPLWDFLKEAYELEYHKVLLPDHVGGLGLTPLQIHLVMEELGWGSFGLSVMLGVACFPFYLATMTGDEELIDEFVIPFCECTDPRKIYGCWAITEPDHGSDILGAGEDFFTSPKMRGNIQAKLNGGEWIINGQKSAWVSAGSIATHAMLHVQIDQSMGMAGYGVCLVPLDQPGVTRGKPLAKMGQRDLNQGEIFFDDVRIPEKYMFVDPDFYMEMLSMILASANNCMSTWSTGLARACFEETLEYTKERVQGGKPLIEHYDMKKRVFQLFARTETCRALSRAVNNITMNVSPPPTEYALVAKTTCTELCFQNAHEAIQILGGNGLTLEYNTEKLFRDARATLIEDGNNETLAREGGHILAKDYPKNRDEML